jgi:hypothetical protein
MSSSLKLPEPIKVSKNITTQLDELEKKGETIVTICGYSNIESLFYLYLIKKYKSRCVTKKTKLLDRFQPCSNFRVFRSLPFLESA